MEFEDSRNALFVEPNAYIQGFEHHKSKNQNFKQKKIVFQQPYDLMPSYYPDNNFKKNNGDSLKSNYKECKHESEHPKSNNFGFDLKSLLPFLGMLGNGSPEGLGSIVSKFSSGEGGFNLANLLPELLKNKDLVSSFLSGFKKKSNPQKKELKTTDFEIKNYTRVE